MSYIHTVPELEALLTGADHIDIKSIEADMPFRAFIANAINYQPGWVTFLYGVRGVFVRFLGMKQEGIPQAPALRPQDIPMTPGKRLAFFNVALAKEDSYLVAEANEQHLRATLAFVNEPLEGERHRFYMVTVVHYNNWAGPVYFNVIRPFHHLVVGGMLRAGVKGDHRLPNPV